MIDEYTPSLEREAYPGAVAGYRAFHWHRGDLYSLTPNDAGGYYRWSLETNEARCTLGRHEQSAPHSMCSCGLWMHRTVEELLNEDILFSHRAWPGDEVGLSQVVLALVAGWGKIVDHTKGMRVQYARPVAFFEAPGVEMSYFRRFAVPEELENHPMALAGKVEREDLGRVAREYGLTDLSRRDGEKWAQFRRRHIDSPDEPALVFGGEDQPPDDMFYPLPPASAYGAGGETKGLRGLIYHDAKRDVSCEFWAPAEFPEDSPASRRFAKDAMRVVERPAGESFRRWDLFSRPAWNQLAPPPAKETEEKLRICEDSLALVRLALLAERETPPQERAPRQEEHINELLSTVRALAERRNYLHRGLESAKERERRARDFARRYGISIKASRT